jgi:hypothetical protein
MGGQSTLTCSQRGNASIESLLVIFFLIVPLFMLVFTMGYLNIRNQKVQGALKLSADKLVTDRDEGTAATASALTSLVTQHYFTDPSDNASVSVADRALTYGSAGGNTSPETLDTINRLMSGVSGRSTVTLDVALIDTRSNFNDSNIQRRLIMGGGPYTFCELESRDFNPLEATNASDILSGALFGFLGVAEYALAPFGGLPPNDAKCP